MATSLFLWPSVQHKADDDGGGDASAEAHLPPPGASQGKMKGRKGHGAKTAQPKRPPQRGLGVAQLELLRVQERLNNITELNHEPARGEVQQQLHFQHHLPAAPHTHDNLVHHHQLAPVSVPTAAMYGTPVAFAGGHPLGCYLPRYPPVIHAPVALGGAAAAARSVLGDHCLRARFRVGCPLPEPPSNQNLQCLDQCEFCARKKRLFGNDLGYNVTNGADYFEMDLAAAMAADLGCGFDHRKARSANERKLAIKEFEFFPPSTRSSSDCGGSSVLTDRKAGDDASSSSSHLDLSLKLSL